ncbi:hypothetical protein FOXG_21556 [Fusarium oxysporum f. sp. lycopersici 4287]|uniref:Uncharacterized protein n=1 Tax=Fusarium oxysporum f. sp. lycopersici (strain 4287 / CBS 123668 / FGSC 9935 / NRRL 34936) TaxID=426428 RepID=A0A0J9VYC5_FUSO4|nr:hypothetical protein FOXG_21556 [Fusarium oxysporum f. sp. lycopersici 4287]XP_018254039.1 hypothetical protein FOXG_21556 [Fusarium oxysporum f. sp. lycopersici 4287]EWZ78223.1 hypothetical protein FOWG_17460 [Fusarium oxysporum f. sp. lycopersici MN25]EWZ78224.1 hypothetical protein FOWG_17460 [Fusarium oxysporum f. sp. lycopersici MN25]KNB15993.1 hypothetical protein FOXG_21556 [Fusarium oxysporum f. sp. lycopersici 4287]KNB15994.1 hypothetical protein FOXG_21556 [Fusarium oxysporum f. s
MSSIDERELQKAVTSTVSSLKVTVAFRLRLLAAQANLMADKVNEIDPTRENVNILNDVQQKADEAVAKLELSAIWKVIKSSELSAESGISQDVAGKF